MITHLQVGIRHRDTWGHTTGAVWWIQGGLSLQARGVWEADMLTIWSWTQVLCG